MGRALLSAPLAPPRCVGPACAVSAHPWGHRFCHPRGQQRRELLLCLPATLLTGGQPEHGLGVESTQLLFLPSASANKRHHPCVTVRSLLSPAAAHDCAPCGAPELPSQHPAQPAQRIPGGTDRHGVSGALAQVMVVPTVPAREGAGSIRRGCRPEAPGTAAGDVP